MLMVVPAGMVSVPLPELALPLQVIDAPVRLTAAVPLNVPPESVRVGSVCAAALLMESVPLATVIGVVIVPVTVFVPDCHSTEPAPLMMVAASKVRVSLVLKLSVVPA